MRFQEADLRRHGWAPIQTLHIPDWCGCRTEYLPLPQLGGGGAWCRSGSRTGWRIPCGGTGRRSRADADANPGEAPPQGTK
jgi:hypothetical protein